MSMIAKLYLAKQTQYGNGQLLELSCVASTETMAMSAGSEEDKLFTTASPWGEMHIVEPDGHGIGRSSGGFAQGDQFYAMVLADDEPHAEGFGGAVAYVHGKCASVTDFGGISKQVEFNGNAGRDEYRGLGIDKFNWRMTIDNPGASDQVKPQKGYWFALYPVTQFDRDQAIAAAHGR